MTGCGMGEGWAQSLVDMAAAQDAGIYDARGSPSPPLT